MTEPQSSAPPSASVESSSGPPADEAPNKSGVKEGWSFQDVVRHLGGATALQKLSTPDEEGPAEDVEQRGAVILRDALLHMSHQYLARITDPEAAVRASRWAWLLPSLLLRPVLRPPGREQQRQPGAAPRAQADGSDRGAEADLEGNPGRSRSTLGPAILQPPD